VYIGVNSLGLSLAGLGVYLFVLLRLNAKAKEFNVLRQQISATVPMLEHVDRLTLEAESLASSAGGDRPFEGLRDSIVFDSVDFEYEVGTRVLRDINLVIPKGKVTALVGRSGAGKSTLADLIPRLRVPSAGSVYFDGISAEDYSLATLRKGIGFLPQDPVFFNRSIRGNLTYGLEPVPSDEAISGALVKAHALEFVQELPLGVDTHMKDQAARLSGGQKQRLALARVLLLNPSVLILDEPTSALDSESEQYIQQALEDMEGRMTIVVIAHRLATVERAHNIVVMENGRIVEQGLHEELLASDSRYARLFNMQIRA